MNPYERIRKFLRSFILINETTRDVGTQVNMDPDPTSNIFTREISENIIKRLSLNDIINLVKAKEKTDPIMIRFVREFVQQIDKYRLEEWRKGSCILELRRLKPILAKHSIDIKTLINVQGPFYSFHNSENVRTVRTHGDFRASFYFESSEQKYLRCRRRLSLGLDFKKVVDLGIFKDNKWTPGDENVYFDSTIALRQNNLSTLSFQYTFTTDVQWGFIETGWNVELLSALAQIGFVGCILQTYSAYVDGFVSDRDMAIFDYMTLNLETILQDIDKVFREKTLWDVVYQHYPKDTRSFEIMSAVTLGDLMRFTAPLFPENEWPDAQTPRTTVLEPL